MKFPLKTLVGAIMVSFVSLAAAQASAPAPTPRVDKRDANQERRVEQGAASGSLTAREEKRLEKRDTVQDKAADKAAADGTITKEERKRLRKAEHRTNRATYRQKHDAQTAAPK